MKLAYSLLALSLVVFETGAVWSGPALTIYNQNFAVVRDNWTLDLQKGINDVSLNDITAHLEPDSVIVRDPSAKQRLTILEQNYRSDPVSQELLLSLFEGKTIDFLYRTADEERIIPGRIIRSGYAPHQAGLRQYGQDYRERQMAYARSSMGQPIIEVNGKLQFSLPGTPLFPSLTNDAILKPTLNWKLESEHGGKVDAEICYVTGGLGWEADYNLMAPEKEDALDMIGWISMDNQSGKNFNEAKIKLMAGDVKKIPAQDRARYSAVYASADGGIRSGPPLVSEKTFDEYHLYTLNRIVTLRDRETKQVEFIRASGIVSKRMYVYDGVQIDHSRYGYRGGSVIMEGEYGAQSNPKVWVMREFINSQKNGLGLPLPKGRMRFYRQDADGQLEFVGENELDHTPRDELVRIYSGNAFDLKGERRRVQFNVDSSRKWIDESFEIKIRNHKKEPAEIVVVEHLYRWVNWELTAKSDIYLKTESQTIEFRARVEPDGEKVITYTVHYTW